MQLVRCAENGCVGRRRLQAVETGPIQLWDCRVAWMGVLEVVHTPACLIPIWDFCFDLHVPHP